MKQLLRTLGMSFDLSRMLPGQLGCVQGGRKLQLRGLNKETPEGFFFPCEQDIQQLIEEKTAALVEEKLQEAIASLNPNFTDPVGTVKLGLWTSPPSNSLFCWGQTLNKVEFPEFWEFGVNWFNGQETWTDAFGLDGNTITLPDCRDEFFRVASTLNLLGQKQGDTMRRLQGYANGNYLSSAPNNVGGVFLKSGILQTTNRYKYIGGGTYWGAKIQFDNSSETPTSEENRPRNIALNAAIKII